MRKSQQRAAVALGVGLACGVLAGGVAILRSYFAARFTGRGADLHGSRLVFAMLQGADLSWSNLKQVDLRHASLRGAYLASADLTGADLACADFRGANLFAARLRGADLTGAKLDPVSLQGVWYHHSTERPPGFDPEAYGAVRVEPGDEPL